MRTAASGCCSRNCCSPSTVWRASSPICSGEASPCSWASCCCCSPASWRPRPISVPARPSRRSAACPPTRSAGVCGRCWPMSSMPEPPCSARSSCTCAAVCAGRCPIRSRSCPAAAAGCSTACAWERCSGCHATSTPASGICCITAGASSSATSWSGATGSKAGRCSVRRPRVSATSPRWWSSCSARSRRPNTGSSAPRRCSP